MIVKKVALAGAAAILFSGLAMAQISSLAGKVTGEDGQPLKDAVIKITRTDIKGNYKTKTNKKGEYFHGGLPLGFYNVVCEVGGKDVDSVNGIKTSLGDPHVVDFDLRKIKARREALQKAAETGQLSQEQARELTPEQRAQMEKQMKERQAALAKNKALNDAFNAGMTALQGKQYDAAIDNFKKAAEMDPKQPAVWSGLADAYMNQGATKTGADQEAAYAAGLDAWSKALELSPTEAGMHNNYALALARSKKFDQAQAELEKAAQLDPPQAGKYFFNLGALYVNAGQLEPSGAAFKRAIEADPNYAEAYYQYGVYLMGKATVTPDGKTVPPEGTQTYFQKYLDLAPNGPSAEAAKGMLQAISATVQTEYLSPEEQKRREQQKKRKR